MKRARWIVVAAFFSLLAVRALVAPAPVAFHNLKEASARIRAMGFRCTSDRRDGFIESGFLVSQAEVPWKEVNEMFKIGKLGPEWQGKVWVSFHGSAGNLVTSPDNGARMWGQVCVFGDQKFLAEIEGILQRRGSGVM